MQESTEKTREQRADEKYQEIRGLGLRKQMEVKSEQDTGNRRQDGPRAPQGCHQTPASDEPPESRGNCRLRDTQSEGSGKGLKA